MVAAEHGARGKGVAKQSVKRACKDSRPWFVSVMGGERVAPRSRGVIAMLKGICLGLAGLAAAGALSFGCMAAPAAATGSALAGQAIERKADAATARCAYVDADGDGACDNREGGTCAGRGRETGCHSGRGCDAGARHGGGAHRCW